MVYLAEEKQRLWRYRGKAEQCRALADRMSDRLAREAFLEIAKSYDRLADQIEDKIHYSLGISHA